MVFYSFSLRLLSVVLFTSLGVAQVRAPISAQAEMWRQYDAIVDGSPSVLTSLNEGQRRKLLEVVSQNEVASLAKLNVYDPPQNNQPTGEIGYCYGRAMAAHLLARRMGLAESAMKKIFAAGDMQNETVRWRFHMAALVAGEDGKLYAIDPIVPGLINRYNRKHGTGHDPLNPVTPEFWTVLIREGYDNTERILQKYPDLANHPEFTGTIKFYVADTDAIMVDMREVPANLETENGERINEILFNPLAKPGFSPVYFTDEDRAAGRIGYYLVESESAKRNYFMTRDEPLVDQFNFFDLEVTIFYIDQDILKTARRFYLYNGKLPGESEFQHYEKGYFPQLLRSIAEFTGTLQ